MNERLNPIYGRSMRICNRNLLPNWYFGSPVNQRGQASCTSGYFIDRWFVASDGKGKAELTSDGIMMTPSGATFCDLRQKIDSNLLPDETVITVSALTADGALWSFSCQFKDSVADPSGLLYVLEGGYHQVAIRSSGTTNVTVAAVKMELGSQQTLAHKEGSKWVLNEIPNFTEELLKCQSYYWKSNMKYVAAGLVYPSHVAANVQFPVKMRAVPTCTIYSAAGTPGVVSRFDNLADHTGTATVNVATLTEEGLGSIICSDVTSGEGVVFTVVANAEI